MRADGLTSIERSEREAALNENRNEEAAIFERAASRLRPSWAGADQMLDQGLANALPEPVPQVVNPPSFAAITSAPASLPAFSPNAAVPTAVAPAAETPNAGGSMAVGSRLDAGYANSSEDTDGFATSAATRRLASLLADHKLALAAVACVVLGGAWAALSGEAPQEAPPAVVAPASVAAVPVATRAVATPAAPAPIAPAKSGELTRDEARALLGLPPEPAKGASKKPVAKAPLAKAPVKAKASLAKAPAKKPVAKGSLPKNPFGPKKPAAKR